MNYITGHLTLKKCSSDLTRQSIIIHVTRELLTGESGGGIIRANWSNPIGQLTLRNDHCSATCVSVYSSRNLIGGNDQCSSIKEQDTFFLLHKLIAPSDYHG